MRRAPVDAAQDVRDAARVRVRISTHDARVVYIRDAHADSKNYACAVSHAWYSSDARVCT
jgi:hypothetical protein